MWAASKGDAEKALLTELLDLTGGAGIDRESTLGDTALTIACARQVDRGAGGRRGEGGGGYRVGRYSSLTNACY